MPRVEGSKTRFFSSCKKNVSLKSEPTRRERGAAQERREEEEEPAGVSGMDTRKDFRFDQSVCFEDEKFITLVTFQPMTD